MRTAVQGLFDAKRPLMDVSTLVVDKATEYLPIVFVGLYREAGRLDFDERRGEDLGCFVDT